MSEGLERLNQASREASEARFLDCCGSPKWARMMTEARPFADVAALLENASQIWRNLDARDWLEAFGAHPKIGARKAAPKQQAQSAEWSRGEQAGTSSASDSVLDALNELSLVEENGYIHRWRGAKARKK